MPVTATHVMAADTDAPAVSVSHAMPAMLLCIEENFAVCVLCTDLILVLLSGSSTNSVQGRGVS